MWVSRAGRCGDEWWTGAVVAGLLLDPSGLCPTDKGPELSLGMTSVLPGREGGTFW